ncbi:hypothetical protein ACNKHT_03655 [Shigella flexneri]
MLNVSALAPDGSRTDCVTLRNNAGMVVTLIDWGATLLSARIPLSDNNVREALLGCQPECCQDQAAFWGPLLVVMPTASPIAVIPLTVKP